ncbi:MarR family transcriptional regulator [Paenibacillus sp. PsM32]|uniref:MarR family transcriptional regulator n=1 Tax=Paenibacillus kyungheensis TaxID=1452732 RepID=A0AAX3M1I8_9BACL|nr:MULTISPECIES: MarR family transcriptional regulator [Paenibacillus]MDN4619033.1 MarR family transcriptional regulator [Paenibacillus sp. PsM32]MDQ1236655.1 MarR family transcriptional repressor of emrRAB [Paenibacillus sp. SORGH_AS_0306]MDR6109012.1 MarR family transcriptional repressor of emrRAB [Paenibacillus sp. SORGH_AS_0338]WCT56072.1 MarR family transcriptional regulator [Paenibacillus kyungheensis]WDF50766.1 MarR family transcriptional regulator [Paenibacillus sp. KACC 21273]
MSIIDSSDDHVPSEEMDKLSELSKLYPDFNIDCMRTSILLIRTSHEIFNETSTLLARHGLSPSKMRILVPLLLRKKPLLPSDLAEYSGVTRSTMTGLINGLEKDGLIRRGAHEDRRMTSIHLTDEGKQLIHSTLPVYMEQINQLMSHITEDEQKVLHRLLYKIQAGLETSKQG